ncbi:hypothetical protein L6164_032100 [Bauhinia variegata]|uniref:Uncharacterized protein n=1 Tax=Bauhinia variegata TaxID=167791 RepID=A0ACB9KMT7_BAUVA|nr:hypothetical protein L6164_032100 [Bauhinia variegata]
MESAGCISEEWGSLSGVNTAEEADFMTHLLGDCSVPIELYANSNLGILSPFFPGHESTIVSVTGINNTSFDPSKPENSTNFLCFSQGRSCSAGSSSTSSENYFSSDCHPVQVTNIGSMFTGFCVGDAKISPFSFQRNDHLSQQNNESINEESRVHLADKNLQASRECEMLVSEPSEDYKSNNLGNTRKRSKSSIEVAKNKRNVKSKKNGQSVSVSKNEEDGSPGLQGQSSSSCSSEDKSNASHELNGGTSMGAVPLKLNGKSAEIRGPATDPQSLYARRRRERINERLRILQNLVPNGTKVVDISTMLEEAVQYVKFLQLQIKLLSSDDLWMYAPIAYNGMNIGLDLNITPTKQP